MIKPNLLILGAGGHGYVVMDVARSLDKYNRISFLDDMSNDENVIDVCSNLHLYIEQYQDVFISFGNPNLREKYINLARKLGFNVPNLISPKAYISNFVNISQGILICAGAIINANSNIGDGCIISANAIIDHNAFLDEYCHINCGAVVKSYSKIAKYFKLNYNEIM